MILHKYRRDLLAMTFLFGLSFFFFAGTFFPGENELILGFDLYWLFQPIGEFAFNSFRQGELPLWNPYLFLGFPQYAEPQLSTFYPPMWLAARLPLGPAYALLHAFHFGLAATGGYVLVRQLGGQWSGAILTGLVITFNSSMVARVHGGHLPHLMTLAYLPWLLAAAHWAVGRRSVVATLLAGLPLGLAMLAGYAPFFPFLVAAVSLMMSWLAIRAWRRGDRLDGGRIIGQLVLLGLFAALLAAVQLLPTLEMAARTSRVAGADYAFASTLSMPSWNLLTLLLPDLYGAPVGDVFYWGVAPINAYWEYAIYVGVMPVILFALAWGAGKWSWRFWFVMGGAGLLLALGPAAALHRILYHLVPGFGFFRVPARMGYFFILAAAILTGLVFDYWFNLPEPEREQRRQALRRLLIVGVVLLAVFILISILWQAVQTEVEPIIQIGGVMSQLTRLLFLGGGSLVFLIWAGGRPKWQITTLAMVILLLDLWGHGYKFIVVENKGPEVGWIMADLTLPENRLEYRVLSRGLIQNSGLQFGFYHVNGYDDFRTATSLELGDRSFVDARIARLLSARYLLHGPDYENEPYAHGWNMISEPAGVKVYERTDEQPRAFIVYQVLAASDEADSLRLISDPELDFTETAIVQIVAGTNCSIEAANDRPAQVEISAYTPQKVVINVNTLATGWLVLNDLYYPGWEATVSGEPATIQPTNYGLRGVCVPAGQHEVVFEFRPVLLTYGLLVTGSALILLLIGLIWTAWAQYRRKQWPGT